MRNPNLIERLVDCVKSQPTYKAADPAYVSVYRHHRCFGGPEEGGWWYDRWQLEGCIPFPTHEQAEEWLEKAKEEVEKANREEAPERYRAMAMLPDEDEETCPAGYSEGYIPNDWDDGGELEVRIEERPGISDNMNEPTPHYE